MELPFVGPSYHLESRPSGVQRTINMVPVPEEPGNERTAWVFKDVPGLTIFNQVIPPVPVDCDLLIHFDETTTADWRDFSIHQHPLTLVTNSGTIAQTPSGEFSGGLALTQVAPGVTSGVFNTQAYIAAEGTYFFGTDEFFVSLVINQGPPGSGLDPALDWGLISNVSPANTGGMYLRLSANGSGGGVLKGGFLAGGFNATGTVGTVLSKNHVAMSRKNEISPGQDQLSLFWNGVLVQGTAVTAGTAGGIQTTRSDILIGCRIDSGGTNAGYQGMVDEVFINHGPGTGVGSTFTVPVLPYSDTNFLPPFA